MQLLQVSERQVQRFQTERRLLNLGYVLRAGKKPRTVYRVDEVMAIKRDLDAKREETAKADLVLHRAQLERRKLVQQRGGGKLAGMDLKALVKTFLEHAMERPSSPVPLRDKLLLTVDECRLFGFPRDFIYHHVHAGNLRNFGNEKRIRISPYDLKALISGGAGELEHTALRRVHGKLSDEEEQRFLKRTG